MRRRRWRPNLGIQPVPLLVSALVMTNDVQTKQRGQDDRADRDERMAVAPMSDGAGRGRDGRAEPDFPAAPHCGLAFSVDDGGAEHCSGWQDCRRETMIPIRQIALVGLHQRMNVRWPALERG